MRVTSMSNPPLTCKIPSTCKSYDSRTIALEGIYPPTETITLTAGNFPWGSHGAIVPRPKVTQRHEIV